MEGLLANKHIPKQRLSPHKSLGAVSHLSNKQNQVGTVMLYGIPIVSLVIESQERLCLAQISNTLLKQYSYNEIHNRRVALGITCVQCTPVQLEILRRAGAMPVSSRRCGMITRREAERLCKSFLGDNAPPRLPDDFAFSVHHECAWGCRGAFLPSRYNSSRAKCIKCTFCGLFFSPNKFIFHSHRTSPNAAYVQPDAANFNSWRRHMKLSGSPPDDIVHAWEDVKAMFNGGTRKRLLTSSSGSSSIPLRPSVPSSVPITIAPPMPKQVKLDNSTTSHASYSPSNTIPTSLPTAPRVPPFPDLTLPISMIDYVWQNGVNTEGIKQFPFTPYAVPWFGNARRSVLGLSCLPAMSSQHESLLQHLCPPNSSDKIYHYSAFRPVFPALGRPDVLVSPDVQNNNNSKMSSEEILLPKKKYSREVEKAGSFSTIMDLNEDDKSSCRSVELPNCESFNKENDFKNGAGKSDPQYSETHANGSPQNGNMRMTFKKELNSETSNDSDEIPKFVTSKYPGQQESKEPLDVSKLLTLKPAIFEENILKFREFSPNIIEAITSLKSEERGVPIYSGIPKKNYSIANDDKTVSPENCNNRKDFSLIDEASESDSRSEKDEDDEPVDVESTDDVPIDKRPSCRSQEVCEIEKPTTKALEEEERSRVSQGEMKPPKIWTIARFSVGEQHETDSVIPQPTAEKNTFYKNHNSEVGHIKGSVPELKNKRNDCLNCRQGTLEKGEIK